MEKNGQMTSVGLVEGEVFVRLWCNDCTYYSREIRFMPALQLQPIACSPVQAQAHSIAPMSVTAAIDLILILPRDSLLLLN